MEAIKRKNFQDPILVTKLLSDGRLLIVDSNTTVRYMDKNTLEMNEGFKANITHIRYKTKVVEFSPNGEFFAVMTSDCMESRLYNAKTKKALAKVSRHQGEVSCVAVDPTGRYMFSGGDDGKTFGVDINTGKLAFTLPVHVDTVNDIAFSDNGQWVATASYDKKILLYNLTMMTPKEKLKVHAAPITKLHFVSKHRLFSVDKNNTAIIWDIYSGKVIHRLQGVHDDVTCVMSGSDDKFLFLGTQLGYVLLYELDKYEQLSRKYIKIKSAVVSMEYDKELNQLLVGSEDGELLFYDIYAGEAKIKELLSQKRFDQVETTAQENPVLLYTETYALLATLWEKTLIKAKHALEQNDKETAIKLFKPFKNIPSKNSIMQKVILEYGEYSKFVALAKGGKIALAYGMAASHPLYKETKIYAQLEAMWQKSFVLAQKFVMDPRGEEKVKEILAPYRGITEKTKLIQDMLTQGEVYKRFRVAISQKEYKIAFELIKQHPFLKEFPDYTALINYGDKLYIKSQELIKAGETHAAIKILRVLVDFSDFTNEARELVVEIEFRQRFFNAIEDKDFATAYDIMARYDDLLATPDGQKLQNAWNKDLTDANRAAIEGNVKEVSQILDKYMIISSKNRALATVYSLCYLTQLERAVKAKRERLEIENGIKNFVLAFGLTDNIENFIQIFKHYYKESKLNIELLTKGSMKMWRPSMIVDSILD